MSTHKQIKIKEINGKQMVNCLIRKRWLVLSPEEWVRQHFLLFIINQLNISVLRIGVEVNLKYNKLNKRADIVVFDLTGKAQWIIECKEQNVKLDTDVLHQISTYNNVLDVRYVSITNGTDTITWVKLNSEFKLTEKWPEV